MRGNFDSDLRAARAAGDVPGTNGERKSTFKDRPVIGRLHGALWAARRTDEGEEVLLEAGIDTALVSFERRGYAITTNCFRSRTSETRNRGSFSWEPFANSPAEVDRN